MLEWYVSTLIHYGVVAVAMAALMWLTYTGLSRVGVRRETATGFALILPWFAGFMIWQVFPILASLYFSFTEYNILQPPRWIGLANYGTMFTSDSQFWPAVRLTFAFAFLSVPLGLAGALATAMLLNQKVRGVGIWRTLYYLPAVLPAFITALLWRVLFLPTRSGLINTLTGPIWRQLSDRPPRWFLDPDLVLWSFVIMSLWGVFGARTVIMLAGLKNIPRELYEVAQLDGAGLIARFRYITLPQLSPTIFYLLVTGAIDALQIFDAPLFVQLAPGSTFLNVHVYTQAFAFAKMGYGAALSWLLFVVILTLTLLIFRSSEAWVYYEAEIKEAK